jgi:hypothetical protein
VVQDTGLFSGGSGFDTIPRDRSIVYDVSKASKGANKKLGEKVAAQNLKGISKGFKLDLKDGRSLYAAQVQAVDEGNFLELYFPIGRVTLAQSIFTPETLEQFGDGAVHTIEGWSLEDHQPHVKNDAPPAEWLSMEASEVALRTRGFSGFGIYASDKPYQRISKVAKDRTVAEKSPGLSKMFYYRDRRNFPALLKSLQDFPKTFEKIEIKNRLNQALVIATSLDTETAVALAECQVRMASPNELPAALSKLIETYYTSGQFVELQKMAERREDYVPVMTVPFPPEIADNYYFKSRKDVKTSWRNHQTALARGEVQRAATLLEQVKQMPIEDLTKKEAKAFKKVVPIAERRMNRFREGLLAGLDEKTQQQVLKQFDYVDFLLSTLGTPKVAAWATLTEDQLLDLVKKTAENKGRQHVQTTDLALYLIEQRGYDGVEIDIGTLLWGGISVQESYGRIRSLPMFILTQKTGVLNRGQTHSQQTLSDQFVVQSAPYAKKAIGRDRTYRKIDELRPVIFDIMDRSIEISSKAPGHTKAYGYHYMAVSAKRTLFSIYGDNQGQLEYTKSLMNDRHPTIRLRSKLSLGKGRHRNGGTERAIELLKSAAKEYRSPADVWRPIFELQEIALDINDQELWDETFEMLEDAYEVSKHIKSSEYAITELKKRKSDPFYQPEKMPYIKPRPDSTIL